MRLMTKLCDRRRETNRRHPTVLYHILLIFAEHSEAELASNSALFGPYICVGSQREEIASIFRCSNDDQYRLHATNSHLDYAAELGSRRFQRCARANAFDGVSRFTRDFRSGFVTS